MGEYTLNDRSPYLRGLILHDERVKLGNLDAALSAYTEAGEEPSQPTPDVKGYMELEATGASPDGGYDIDIVAQKEGAPVGGDPGGRFRWKHSADGLGDWRGCLSPTKVTGFEWPQLTNGGGVPQVISTPASKAVLVFYDASLAGAMKCQVRDPIADTWGSAVTVDDANILGSCRPGVIRFPDTTENGGRLVAFYVVTTNIAGVSTRVLAFSFSDDDGATWTRGSGNISGFSTTGSVTDIAAVYHAGFVTLVLVDSNADIVHLVSTDLGSSFTEVETISYATYNSLGLVKDSADTVILITAGVGGGIANDVLAGRKASPFAKFADDPSWDTKLSDGAAHSIAPTIDDAGFLWVVYRNTTEYIIGMERFDAQTLQPAKDRWNADGLPLAPCTPIDTGGDAAEYLSAPVICAHKAGILMVSTWESAVAGANPEIAAVLLGGYSSVDWQTQTFGWQVGSPSTRSGMCYFPFQKPSLISGWTSSGGAATETVPGVVNSGLLITSTANELSMARLGSTAGKPVLIWARVRSTSGGSLGAEEIGFTASRADGAVQFQVSLRVNLNAGSQELRLWDTQAGSQVGTDATGLTSGFLDVLVAMETTKVSAWYKLPASEVWTAWISGLTIVDGGAGLAANRIVWGNQATGTATSEWMMLNSCIDEEGSPLGLTTFSNPTDLQGRAFSTGELYLTDGTRLSATAGPAYQGDSWDAVSRAQYGVQHIHPEISPSPSVMWRQRGLTLAHLAWSLDAGITTRLLSSSIGCALIRPNFREAFLEGYDGVGWTTLLTFDGAETVGASLTYQIDGNHLRAAAGSPAGVRFLEGNELVGGYVELDYSGGGGGTVVASIAEHTEGVWRAPNAARSAEFRVRSSSLASINTPTNCRFIPPILVGVRHNAIADYQAYRIRIPSGQDTKQGYYQLGGIVLGPLAVLGMQNSWGRTVALEPNQEIVTTTSGARQVRELGPARRRVELSWTDGWDTSQLYQADPDPDYIVARTGAGYEGIGVRDDATLLRGVLSRQSGAVRPVVYLPKIDQATPADNVFQYSSPAKALYGRIVSPVTSTDIMGNEAQDEVVTIDAVTIEEEV